VRHSFKLFLGDRIGDRKILSGIFILLTSI